MALGLGTMSLLGHVLSNNNHLINYVDMDKEEVSMNQIYTAGAITGLEWEDHFCWRDDLAATITETTKGRWHVFNPSLHMSDLEEWQMTNREGMDYDLHHLLRSDLMIINFAHNPSSIGTAIEFGAAYSHNIPILGLNEYDEEIYPWEREMCLKIFDDYNIMVNYLVNHFINEK